MNDVTTDTTNPTTPSSEAAAPASAPAAAEIPAGSTPAAEAASILGEQPNDGAAADGSAKADDKAATPPGAPEKYEFNLPDGVKFDDDAFVAAEPIFRELNLGQEAASKIVGVYAEKVLPLLQDRAQQQASAAGDELRAEWARSTMADTEVGGGKLEESKAMAARAMAQFLPQNEEGQKFRTFLNESGLGNHPEMVRMLSRIGRAMGEASTNMGTTAAAPMSMAEKFYGKNYAK